MEPTEHVYPLVMIEPWTDLSQAVARLNSYPEGKRFVVFHHITDDLAIHPADRVISRTWETRTRQVAVPPSVTTRSAPSTPVFASRGRVPGGAAGKVARIAATGASTMTTVTERVPVDRLTEFRGPWFDHGIRTVSDRVGSLMQRLKAAGAQVDGFVLSNETNLATAFFLERPGSLRAIERDPRWPELARSLGLPLVVSDMAWGSEACFLWAERMAGRFDAAMNRAVFDPIRRAYPKAVVSNFNTGRMTAAHASPDINGFFDRRHTAGFGTHDNFEFYGCLGYWRIQKTKGEVPVDQSWISFRVEMHKIRGMNASSSRPKHAWIASRSWDGESWSPVALASHPLWDELILQLGMHGVRQFLELNADASGRTLQQNLVQRPLDRQALDALMGELNGRVSGSDGGILVAAQPSWNDRVIATGRRLADRVVWRFSFADGIDAVRVRISDGSEAIISREPGRHGAWFEHAPTVSMQMDPSGRMPSMQVIESPDVDGPDAQGEQGS